MGGSHVLGPTELKFYLQLVYKILQPFTNLHWILMNSLALIRILKQDLQVCDFLPKNFLRNKTEYLLLKKML